MYFKELLKCVLKFDAKDSGEPGEDAEDALAAHVRSHNATRETKHPGDKFDDYTLKGDESSGLMRWAWKYEEFPYLTYRKNKI